MPAPRSQLVFVGTGVSTAIPVMGHIMGIETTDPDGCCCQDAMSEGSRNKRNNVSMLVRYQPPGGGTRKEILIDCGKTFRDAAMHTLAPAGVQRIDCLLLTHDHADATGGLDDVRDLQIFDQVEGGLRVREKLPTYMTQLTLDVLEKTQDYVIEASREDVLSRRVTSLDLRIVPHDVGTEHEPFDAAGLAVQPVPVYHGGDYVSLGFAFGERDRVVYISDVSTIPEAQMAMLKRTPIHTLVLDCLLGPGRERHYSHLAFDQAMEVIEQLQPEHSYLVGMFCSFSHERGVESCGAFLADLRERHPETSVTTVDIAYDGLTVYCDL